MANPDSIWGESDEVREENIRIYENSQNGLDKDGNPFDYDDGEDGSNEEDD